MSLINDPMEGFHDYIEYYPSIGEPGHERGKSGIKGLLPNAPEEAKIAYSKWLEFQKECARKGIKV